MVWYSIIYTCVELFFFLLFSVCVRERLSRSRGFVQLDSQSSIAAQHTFSPSAGTLCILFFSKKKTIILATTAVTQTTEKSPDKCNSFVCGEDPRCCCMLPFFGRKGNTLCGSRVFHHVWIILFPTFCLPRARKKQTDQSSRGKTKK